MVVATDPDECIAGEAIEDGQCGEGGSGAVGVAPGAHFTIPKTSRFARVEPGTRHAIVSAVKWGVTAQALGGAMTTSPDGETDSESAPCLDLTARETAILCLIAEGHTNTQTAKRLQISHHTVAQHIADMLRRAQASSRGELIARAYTAGLLATNIWPPRPART